MVVAISAKGISKFVTIRIRLWLIYIYNYWWNLHDLQRSHNLSLIKDDQNYVFVLFWWAKTTERDLVYKFHTCHDAVG